MHACQAYTYNEREGGERGGNGGEGGKKYRCRHTSNGFQKFRKTPKVQVMTASGTLLPKLFTYWVIFAILFVKRKI